MLMDAYDIATLQACRQLLAAYAYNIPGLIDAIDSSIQAAELERTISQASRRQPVSKSAWTRKAIAAPCPSCGEKSLLELKGDGDTVTVCRACRWSRYGVMP